MNHWHFMKGLLSNGSLDPSYWCVTGDGLRHALKYSSSTFHQTTVTVNTKCAYGAGRGGKDAQIMRGVPNCLICAAL